ncbi:MAG: hypothetical protein E7476_01845 [Ruminococcaceae bacterium]|nr:hypothetical protein [Oscillospiraceae bacterium]
MDNKKVYYIPPKLNRSYQLGGFTVMELILFFAIGIGAWLLAFNGFPSLLSVPAVLLVLHWRASPDGRNVKQLLAMRLRYFKRDHRYSLQECEKRK